MRSILLASTLIYASVLPRGDGPPMGCLSDAVPVETSPTEVLVSVAPDRGDWWISDCVPVEPPSDWRGNGHYRWHLPTAIQTRDLSGACDVRAYRRDGALQIRSAPIRITPGDEGNRVLTLPEQTTGGIGFSFEVVSTGARVIEVHPGTPADGLLFPGDLIVAVDDVPTAGLSAWAFVDHSLGPVGSQVRLSTERTGLPAGSLSFVRQAYRPSVTP